MNSINLSSCLLLLAGSALLADPTAVVPTSYPQPPVDAQPKSTDLLAEALPVLQQKYIDFAQLSVKSNDQLKDLVARSNGGIRLLDQPWKPTPIIVTLLPNNIGYLRLASFTPEKTWQDLGTQIDQWSALNVPGIILDLRSNVLTDDITDYAGAMQVAAFFAHDQNAPFSMSVTAAMPAISFHPAHPFHGPVVVITNHKTGSAAEALAGYLKTQGALIIGQPTGGNGRVYDEKVLSTGQVLLYGVMTVDLADGTQLWNHPVVPDISMTVNEQSERGALILIGHHDVLDVIGESPNRHLMSEAALIQGIDPEWDTYLASLEKHPVLLSLPVVRDDVLISAIDSLKAIQVSQKGPDPATRTDDTHPTSTSLQ